MSNLVVAREPWAQRPDETDEEFRAFHSWLMSTPRRSPPVPMAQAAVRLDWTQRATAYDSVRQVPSGQLARFQQTAGNMLELALLSSSKLLEQQRQSPMSVLTPKELVQLVGCLTQLQEVEGLHEEQDTNQEALDLSGLSDEEFAALAEAQAVLRKLGG